MTKLKTFFYIYIDVTLENFNGVFQIIYFTTIVDKEDETCKSTNFFFNIDDILKYFFPYFYTLVNIKTK